MTTDRPYARYAFLNIYNLVLLAGLMLVGFVTDNEWLAIVAAAAEALWLIYAPSSRFLRRIWFDPAFERAEAAFREEARKKKSQSLTGAGRARLVGLLAQKATIERLARENPSLAVDLLKSELVKLDALVGEFIDLNVTAERAEQHAATFDFDAMQRSWQHHSKQAKAGPAADPRRVIAEQNLAVLRQRRARYDDLTRSIQVARGQMELVEQTFRLLADEILTMASPSELGGRIDELRVAVDAARETTIDPFDVIPEAELEELEVHEGHW
jgi:hypothetical protein